MLKIREYKLEAREDGTVHERKVDLKELKKYGFEKNWANMLIKTNEYYVELEINPSNRVIEACDDCSLDIVYDLIQAGLVEKVEG